MSASYSTRSSDSSPRILVIAPAWIGDIVIAQSLLMLLRQQYPGARIDVLALDWARPIIQRMAEADDSIEFPAAHGQLRLAAIRQTSQRVREIGYDQAIVLRNNLKSALVPWLSRIPRRTGYLGETRYGLINDIRPLDTSVINSRVAEYLALGIEPGAGLPTQIPLPQLRVDLENRRRLISELELGSPDPVVAIAPGASFGPAKRWPLPHFTALAHRLADAGHMVWVMGGPAESEMGDRVAASVGTRVRNLCGRTSLVDAIDLLSAADCMVGADSGLTHIASASGARVVGLYGPTSPDYAPPLSERAITMSRGLACSPCRKRECPLGHGHCMTRIDVTSVFAACSSAPLPAESRHRAN